MLATAPQTAAKPDQCRRCSGKGEFKMYVHVKAGVCFRCWGCGLDLPTIEARLKGALDRVITEYRKARRAQASESVLDEIVTRGVKARHAYNLQLADSAALARAHQTTV
jgi:hypothetical protein